jgi:hypothetical protein
MSAERTETEWLDLVWFANDTAMAYRRKNEELRRQITDLKRSAEIYRKLIADFERQGMEPVRQSAAAPSTRTPVLKPREASMT